MSARRGRLWKLPQAELVKKIQEGRGAGKVTHLPSLSPQPPLSLWASVCGKLLNVEFELNMRDYIEKPDCEYEELKREERACGGVFA